MLTYRSIHILIIINHINLIKQSQILYLNIYIHQLIKCEIMSYSRQINIRPFRIRAFGSGTKNKHLFNIRKTLKYTAYIRYNRITQAVHNPFIN